MEDFLRVNPGLSRRIPNFLQLSDYTPMELAEITNKILLTYEIIYPHGVLDMFVRSGMVAYVVFCYITLKTNR